MKRKLSMAFIVVAIMSLALAASPVFGGNDNGVEKANQAQEKVNQKVLSKKDVVGTAVGLDEDGKAVVRVFTAKSGVVGIPKEQDGIKIVAQVTGLINSLGSALAPHKFPTRRPRPNDGHGRCRSEFLRAIPRPLPAPLGPGLQI